MPRDPITWFEIPALDLERAQDFYQRLLGTTLRRETIAGSALAVFAGSDDGVGGCLQSGPNAAQPQAQGTLVYLAAGPSLDAVLKRATALGGSIATPRTALPPGMGFFAHIIDSEGNRVGLHAAA